MKVSREVLEPVHCVSRPGISSGTLFTKSERQQTGRYLTDKEMTAMYNKFVGPNSLNNAAVRLEQEEWDSSVQHRYCTTSFCTDGSTSAQSKASRAHYTDSGDRTPPPPSASIAVAMAAAGVDLPAKVHPPVMAESVERSANAATMKYVAPKIAKKYGIQQSITPAGPRAAAAAAARAGAGRGGAAGGRGSGVVAAAADRLQATESTSSYSSGDGLPPRPRSAAFKTTTREQAQRTGSHFLSRGPSEVPPLGKYNPKYGAMDKAQHAPLLGKAAHSGTGSVADSGAAAASSSGSAVRRSRPGSAPASAGGRGGSSARPSSAPAHRMADDSSDPSVPRDVQAAAAAAAHTQPGASRHGLTRSLSSQGGPPRLTLDVRAQLLHRHEELFGAAHKVHQQRPTGPPGTQPFKATERKPLYDGISGNQLFGEYYREGYDSLTRKTPRPSSAFRTQSQRQLSNTTLGETGPTVGPGTYGKQIPGTNTGRHVQAGHSSLTRTPDWSRTTPRPTSAPPARSPPASAVHQGYYGPNGPASSVFPDEPEYDELNAVRMLQERTVMRVPGLPPRPRETQSQNYSQQQQQQRPQGQGRGGAGGGGADCHPPLVYVGPERYGELSNTGLAKRAPGWAFGTATREGTCQTLRAISKPNITPPAAVTTKLANDLSYDYDISVEGHRSRNPAWALPPNRNALSQHWMQAAATAYLS
ncbi:hypothetical protein VOLCADRAFT_92993 [Volvox carteri f. nagariensis]|uniref:Uncharacterized protein n=1 Tax=Volvox carteri f. nagariensis TaxID=3068 RepID=D8U119_VOLCA|nr:uncharacterized protein VOLCADRAFT_92993 [Volvox carteri f. nagariensis]EFJ46481.1 hypothetical protein VOLCADRAFT_92993 [Volvox carteri f. nagariensis]|eukprot:XP_002952338.1 hypothetical protein VOLCADRAFT_92993 [Volvox carteri f. nagariensis]